MAEDQNGAEKNFDATSKKLNDLRKKGTVPNSKDVSGFISLFISMLSVYLFFEYILDYIKDLNYHFVGMYGQEITIDDTYGIMLVLMKSFALIILPIAGVVMVSGVLGSISQFGFLFSVEPIKPKISKINPIAGLKRILSMHTLVMGTTMVSKSFIILIVAFILIMGFLEELPTVNMFNYFDQLIWLKDKSLILVIAILIILLIFSAIDLAITKYKFANDNKMTYEEITREMKDQTVDPTIKNKVRQRGQEILRNGSLKDVEESDVVITNPTHYAVAVKYKIGVDTQPKVLMKGVDLLAQRIKELAKEYNVPIVEDKPLARSLYKLTKIGENIPQELWEPLAKVLSFVYTQNKKK
jgi:flagellar biosynthetic protein FlhB